MKSKTLLIIMVVSALAVLSWADEITPRENNQLKAVFPEATEFSEQHAELTGAQVSAIEKTVRGKVLAKYENMGIFRAGSDSAPLGYAAFFDAKEPDGDIVPAGVGVGMDGKIAKVVIFTHHIDENPLAQEDFLGQFVGKDVADSESWHPDHSIKLVVGREQDSLDTIRAIWRTAAIIVEAKHLKNGAEQKASSESPKQQPTGQVPEPAGHHYEEAGPHTH